MLASKLETTGRYSQASHEYYLRRNLKLTLRREDGSLKFFRISTALMLLLLVCTSVTFASNNQIVATINGQDITLEAFYNRLENEAGQIILSQMILEELIAQKQQETNVHVTDEDLSEVLSDIVTQFGGFESLQNYLYENGMTENQLIEELEFNILINKLAQYEVKVTDEDIQDWFKENQEFFNLDEEVKASHILVDTEAEALEIFELLSSGANFGELAQTRSQDPGSAASNGELGYFGRGMMVKPFEDKAFSLAVDELGMVQSEFGWHIILVTDKQEAREATLEEAWELAKMTLIEYKSMSPYEYIDKLHREANIEVYR